MPLPIDLVSFKWAVPNTMKSGADTRTVSGPNSYDLELQIMTFFGSRAFADIIKMTSYQGDLKANVETTHRKEPERSVGWELRQIDGIDQNLGRGKERSPPRAARWDTSPLILDVIAEKRNSHCVTSSKYTTVCYTAALGKLGRE